MARSAAEQHGIDRNPADSQPRLLADLQEHGYPQETKQEETE